MKTFLTVIAIIIIVALVPLLLSPSPDSHPEQSVTGLPWQIETTPEGNSRVFGLTLGSSTLADAHTRFGEGETALVAAPGETESVEVYFDTATLGAVTGKLVVTAEIDAVTIKAMRERAYKTEYMQSATKKSRLAEQDLATAKAAPIRGLALVPSVNLDEEMIVQRFGTPAERIRVSENAEHLLYPDRGLDIVFDTKGKEVLQYVAPRNFAQLRDPLVTAAGEKKN
jgi:hypothetical protein